MRPRRVAAGWLFLAMVLGTPPGSRAAHLTGTVKAEARVKNPQSAGGGAYANRALQSAARFDYDSLQNVVVFAVPLDSGASSAADAGPRAVEMAFREDRSEARAEPDFLLARAGTSVSFRNATRRPVTVFAGGASPDSFTLAVSSKSAAQRTLTESGLYEVGLLEFPDARAEIFAAGPYSALAGSGGRFDLEIPPGRYAVTAWHRRLPEQTREILVPAQGTATADFVLSVKGLPEVP